MPRLIDADALIENHFSDEHKIALSYANKLWMRRIINGEPTIEADPVRHGRWIPTGMSNSTGPIVRCSACGQYINPSGTAIDLKRQKLEPKFCEKCGARMDGDSNG